MDEALRVVVEMNDHAWRRFKRDVEGVTPEEANWRPVPEANSINLILRHVRIDVRWHVASIERSGQGRIDEATRSESLPLDFEANLREVDESCARFIAILRTLSSAEIRRRTLLAYQGAPQAPPSEQFLGFHFALHLTAHDGQIRTLRNLYRKLRGEPARFFPDNPTFPAS